MTVTLRLWEVADAYRDTIEQIVEAGGEITLETEAALDAADTLFTRKAEQVAQYIRNLMGTADAAQAEADRLRALAVSRSKTADSLKGYLKLQMERIGTKMVETPTIKLRIQQNSRPSIAWTVDGPPPEGYQRVTVTPDLTQAYETYKAGEPLPAGFAVTHNTHLRIT